MAKNPWWAPWALTRLIEPSMRRLVVQIPQIAGMKAGESVLDVCCGTGASAIYYAQIGLNAAGIDIDKRVIDIATKRVNRSNLQNVSFQTASALELPFDNSSFNHVSIIMGLHEMKVNHRNTIISEMKRVTKDNGTLIFLDYMVPLPRNAYYGLAVVTEFLAGSDHNRCFKEFIKLGGLRPLLKSHQLEGKRAGEHSLVEILLAHTSAGSSNPHGFVT